jgi:hypothetical protein
MCPICISTGALIATGCVSSGGVAALVAGGLWRQRKTGNQTTQKGNFDDR